MVLSKCGVFVHCGESDKIPHWEFTRTFTISRSNFSEKVSIPFEIGQVVFENFDEEKTNNFLIFSAVFLLSNSSSNHHGFSKTAIFNLSCYWGSSWNRSYGRFHLTTNCHGVTAIVVTLHRRCSNNNTVHFRSKSSYQPSLDHPV